MFYQNSRSLKATIKDPEGKEVVVFKLGILKDIVYSADYNIVAITETWLNSKEINKIWKGETPYIWTGSPLTYGRGPFTYERGPPLHMDGEAPYI